MPGLDVCFPDVEKWFSTRVDHVLKGMFSNVWRIFWLSQMRAPFRVFVGLLSWVCVDNPFCFLRVSHHSLPLGWWISLDDCFRLLLPSLGIQEFQGWHWSSQAGLIAKSCINTAHAFCLCAAGGAHFRGRVSSVHLLILWTVGNKQSPKEVHRERGWDVMEKGRATEKGQAAIISRNVNTEQVTALAEPTHLGCTVASNVI